MASRTAVTEADLHRLESEIIDIPPKFRSKHAQVLADAGYHKKAVRICKCGSRMRKLALDGCMIEMRQHCRTWFCTYCGRMLADEVYERWQSALDIVVTLARSLGIKKFTLVMLWQPIARDRLKEFFSGIDQVMLMGPDMDNRDIAPLFKRMRRYVAGRVELPILYLSDNLITGIWKSLFPKATVNVWYFPIEQLHDVFKEQLFDLALPLDDEECGQQEALFGGMHQFAAEGLEMESKTKFTEDTPSVNLPPSPELIGHDCGMGKCIHGCYFTKRTRWFEVAEPFPPAEFVEYEDAPHKTLTG